MREPGLKFGKPLRGWPGQGGVSPCGPREGGADESFREEFAVRIPRVERDDIVGGTAHGGRVQGPRGLGCPQRRCLPAVVRGPGRAVCPHEGSDAGTALDEALGRECPQGFLHCDGACLIFGNELSRGWQFGSRRRPCDPFFYSRDDSRTAIVIHES
ncbi:hypothetical protein D3C73_1279230 [compost metagenome]